MPADWFFSVDEEYENTVVISKSRFIATLIPIKDHADALEKVKAIGKKYSGATHNCYAFISNSAATEQKFSDDGEPQGTAGMPMLEVLRKRKVYMTLAVVTRYFGGIKLGANGLVGAYSTSVAQALDRAIIHKNEYASIYEITCGYATYKKASEICAKHGGQCILTQYDKDVQVKVALPEKDAKKAIDEVVDLTQGAAGIVKIGEGYFKFEI